MINVDNLNELPGIKLSLMSIYDVTLDHHGVYIKFLYDLLKERLDSPDENISHTKMPTWEEHLAFIGKQPYNEWYVIVNLESPQDCIGSTYISYKEEIGIHISQAYQGRGYGPTVLQTIIDSLPKRCYYANINPKNNRSKRLFERFGFEPVQITYKLLPVQED